MKASGFIRISSVRAVTQILGDGIETSYALEMTLIVISETQLKMGEKLPMLVE